MSFFEPFDRIAITGLSNAQWLRDKSLDSIRTVPAGTTYAVIEFYAGGTYGFQDSDDTTDFVYPSVTSSSIDKFVKVNAAKSIDLYVSSIATGGWRLRGYTSSITPLVSPVAIGSFTGAGTKTIDCSTIVPTGAINGSVLIEFNLNMKVGALLNLATQDFPNKTEKAHLIVPLDASRYFYVLSGGANINAGDIKILGWLAPEAYQHETVFTKIAPSALSTWEKLAGSWSTVFDSWRMYSSSDSHLRSIRRNGSSYTEFQNLNNRFTWVNPSTAGEIDGWKNNIDVTFQRFGGFVADTSAAAISTLDTFVAGATATVVFDKSVASVTKLRVTSNVLSLDGVNPIDTHYIDITSFSGSGTTWTFTVPSPTDATDGIRFGAVTITPTTNSGAGADFTSAIYSKTDYDSVNIETPVSGNVCEGDDPELAENDQLAHEHGEISVGGVYSDSTESFIGSQTIWHYSVSDYKWYSFTLTTEPGGPAGTRPNTTLSKQTDGLSPRFTSRFPLGNRPVLGGSNSVISWQALNGEIKQDRLFRVTAVSTTFAPRQNAYPTMIDDGITQIYNNVADHYFDNKNDGFVIVPTNLDFNSPWYKPSTGADTVLVDRLVNRYSGQGFTYKLGATGDNSCFLGWHKTLLPDHTVESDEFYFSWHMKNSSPFFAHRYYALGSGAGSFNLSADGYGVGEAITFVAVGGTIVSGFVIAVRGDGSLEYVLSDSPAQIGGTITGNVSGATLTVSSMSSTFLSSSSNKILRLWNGDENLPDRYRALSWSSDLCDSPDSINGNHFTNSSYMQVDTWGFFETIVKCLDRTNRIFRTVTKINGHVFHDLTGVDDAIESASAFALSCALVGKDPNQPTKSRMWVSSLTMDTSLTRVILTDNAVYENSTKFECQMLSSSSTSILEGKFRLGALGNSGGVYMHVFNDVNPVSSVQIRT